MSFLKWELYLISAKNTKLCLSSQNQQALDILKTSNFKVSKNDFIKKLVEKGVTGAKPENYDRTISRIIDTLSKNDSFPENFDFLT